MIAKENRPLSERQRGDFQTPDSLVTQIWSTLDGSFYDIIIEPTFGLGTFFTSMPRKGTPRLVGWEIHGGYYDATVQELMRRRYSVDHLFPTDVLSGSVSDIGGVEDSSVLVIGNPPWVTNSEQGSLGGKNTGQKSNVKSLRGMDALTGKSNFDIAEAVILHIFNMLSACRNIQFALLVKFSVATNLLKFLGKSADVGDFEFHRIDAQRYFGAAVDAGLLKFKVSKDVQRRSTCLIYEGIAGALAGEITTVGNQLIYDASLYARTSFMESTGTPSYVWRQGIKHDVGKVLELRETESGIWNGFGEPVDIESEVLHPLYKGSEIFHGRKGRYVIPMYQNDLKDSLHDLPERFPKLHQYLLHYKTQFEQRKSRIYQNKPPFVLFGVGSYTYAPYKVAIAALYTQPMFRILDSDTRPAIIDDTCYMLATDCHDEAIYLGAVLNLDATRDYLLSISWQGNKRRFTKDTLARVFVPPMSECPVEIITALRQCWNTERTFSAEIVTQLQEWLAQHRSSDKHSFQRQLFQ